MNYMGFEVKVFGRPITVTAEDIATMIRRALKDVLNPDLAGDIEVELIEVELIESAGPEHREPEPFFVVFLEGVYRHEVVAVGQDLEAIHRIAEETTKTEDGHHDVVIGKVPQLNTRIGGVEVIGYWKGKKDWDFTTKKHVGTYTWKSTRSTGNNLLP